VTSCGDQKEEKIGVKGLSMLNGSVNDVVMDDVKNGKAQTFDIYHEMAKRWWQRAGVNAPMQKELMTKVARQN
jgi:hypothetical protein